MSAPQKFLRKLNDFIGAEATDAVAEWMNRTDEKFDELTADIAELRHEMRVGFAKVETAFAKAEAAAAERHSAFMKWTMGFWVISLVTYVGALVALANVLK